MAHWILQNNLYSEDGFAGLTEALDRLSISYSIHRCVPFAGTLEPDASPPAGRVIVMGSYTLARHARERGWTPGAWLDNLDFEIQRERWGSSMFNHDAVVCRIGDVPEQPGPFFIRPVLDTKSFTGQVMEWFEFDAWRERIVALTPEDAPTITVDTRVMVCSNKEIYSETRFWIVDQEIVTCSGYKLGTTRRYSPRPARMLDPETTSAPVLARRMQVADRQPPVFDTAAGPAIGEINNLNSAGFYKADMNKLVMALEDCAESKPRGDTTST